MSLPAATHPRVSLLLLAYNQQSMVERAAQSCLAQICEPLEIVLSDDASSDGTFEVLQRLADAYRGPHTVRARRSASNVGIGEHYNQLLRESSGELLVTAAGDDFSEPHRVRRLVEAWEANGRRADLIASHVVDLDHDGQLHEVIRVDDLAPYRNVADWASHRPYIIGAGHAFTRRMMERFGPMSHRVFYEDQIMTFRAIVMGGGITVDEPLVHYRRGGTSRKPEFESAEHKRFWTERQLGRELAEMEQLVADAAVAGCEKQVWPLFEKRLRRERYLRDVHLARNHAERWQAFQAASPMPTWWRVRKLLHAGFPDATRIVKRMLSVFHSRTYKQP
jgi:glycosyltransferase involved in cell wall biosynthesis